MKRAIGTILFLLVVTAFAAAGPRPWTSDDVLAFKAVADPQVSPDGRVVAYVVESLNEEKDACQTDVWLVPTVSGEARPLMSSPANDPTAYLKHTAVFRAGRVRTPSLIVHGGKDYRVPTSQGGPP